MVESDVVLGGAQFISREIKPPRGMALRLSGQIIRPDSNEATFNFSGVAPEQLGEHVIPSFNLRFARKVVVVPEIRLRVSDQVTFRREAQARAELVLPDRVLYVGELVRGAIRMRGGDDEAVVASYGLESLAEGFSMAVTAERQPLPDALGQGLQTTFDLTPIREGAGEFALNGIMLVQNGEAGAFNQGGRDRPSPSAAASRSRTCRNAAARPSGTAPSAASSPKACRSRRTSPRSANPSASARS